MVEPKPRLPPLKSSWWAVHATVRLSSIVPRGLIRIQYPNDDKTTANHVVFEQALPIGYTDPRYSALSLEYLLHRCRAHHALLQDWEL